MNDLQSFTSSQEPARLEAVRSDVAGIDPGRLDLLAAVARRKWLVILTMLTCVILALLVTRHMAKHWRAEAQLLLIERPVSVANSNAPDYTAPIAESMETQVGMLKTPAMAEKAISYMKQQAYAEGLPTESVKITPEEFQNALIVFNPLNSNLINISVEAPHRDQAAIETNAIAQTFVNWKKELAQKDLQVAETTLQRRTDQARRMLLAAEQAQTGYEQSHHLVNIEQQQKSVLDDLAARAADVATLQQDLQFQTARVNTLASQLRIANQSISGGKGVRDDSLVLSLQNKLNELQMLRADQAQKVTKAYPGVLSGLDAQIADVQKRFAQAVQSTVRNQPSLQTQGSLLDAYQQAGVLVASTRARLQAASQLRDAARAQMTVMPQTNMDYARLVRNTQMAGSQYRTLQSALETAHVEKDKITGNVRITQGATAPLLPFRPSLRTNILVGGLVGLLLSLLAVALLEKSDRRVRNLADVRSLISGQIVGSVPQLSLSQMQELSDGVVLPEVVEAFSLVRVNLALAMRGRGLGLDLERHQAILVTSALPGEGKSMTAAQVARSIADLGKRVILVDANMRRPSTNGLFKSKQTPGLAEILAGEKILEEVLVLSEVKNLLLLHSGVTAYNPTDLLSHPRLGDTLRALRQRADVVVIDAPDCATVADTALLTPYADCLLQVIRIGHSEREAVSETAQALEATGKNTVFLVNGILTPAGRAAKNSRSFVPFASRKEYSILDSMEPVSNGIDKTMVMSAISIADSELLFSKGRQANLEQRDTEN